MQQRSSFGRDRFRGQATTRVGVIADTHGLLRPEAVDALEGSDLIVHAGDIGKPGVLEALRALAPRLHVVRGNVDLRWAHDLPDHEEFAVQGHGFHLLHDLKQLEPAALPSAVHCVVSGHSHRAAVRRQDGVLYVNPGSAGPRRFSLPVTLARLEVTPADIRAEIVTLLA